MSPSAQYEFVQEGETLVLRVSQWARFETADYRKIMHENLSREEFEQCKNAIVDCSGMDYANSMFLEALLQVDADMRKRGGKFCLCGVEPFVRELIQITHLDQRWPIYETCDDARAALAEG